MRRYSEEEDGCLFDVEAEQIKAAALEYGMPAPAPVPLNCQLPARCLRRLRHWCPWLVAALEAAGTLEEFCFDMAWRIVGRVNFRVPVHGCRGPDPRFACLQCRGEVVYNGAECPVCLGTGDQ